MSDIFYAPSNISIAAAISPLGGETPDNFRTNINSKIAALDAKVQAAAAFAEQLSTLFGNGAISGGTISAGTGLQVTLTAFSAIVGNIVGYSGTRTIPTTVDLAIADNTTNYLYLRQDGSFTVNATGVAPTDLAAHGQYLLWGTVTTSGGVVTAVTNVRRLMAQNLSTIYTVSSDPSAPLDGDVWYNTGSNVYKTKAGGTVHTSAAGV